MGKWCLHASLFLGNKDMFKNYKRFDFWHVQTADIGGTKPWKNNCSLIWKLFKFLMTLLAGSFIKVAGNQDRHKSSVEFGPLVSMAHLYVFFKWDLTLAHWTQVSVRCPLGYLFNWSSSYIQVMMTTINLGWGWIQASLHISLGSYSPLSTKIFSRWLIMKKILWTWLRLYFN